MAGNTQMNENERGIFKLNGITGMLVAVVLLLSILGFLVFNALIVQQREASNFYKINQDLILEAVQSRSGAIIPFLIENLKLFALCDMWGN